MHDTCEAFQQQLPQPTAILLQDWHHQSQTSDDETVEEGQSKTVAPAVEEKQGLDWEDDERMEEEDSDEAPELFDMNPAAPELPTVQIPSRWNLRADPRKWSCLGPGGVLCLQCPFMLPEPKCSRA